MLQLLAIDADAGDNAVVEYEALMIPTDESQNRKYSLLYLIGSFKAKSLCSLKLHFSKYFKTKGKLVKLLKHVYFIFSNIYFVTRRFN